MTSEGTRDGAAAVTRVDFAVAAHAVRVHDALEARRQLVGLVVGGRSLLGLHPVEDGGHGGATLLLDKQTHHNRSHPGSWSTAALRRLVQTFSVTRQSCQCAKVTVF